MLLIDDYESFDIADEDFSIPFSEILENSPKEIFEKAKTFRNDIKLAETNISIAEKDIKIAKSFRLPSITSFYSWNTRISYLDNLPSFEDQFDLNKGQTYGLGLNIPIFQGRAISNNIERSKINLEIPVNFINEDIVVLPVPWPPASPMINVLFSGLFLLIQKQIGIKKLLIIFSLFLNFSFLVSCKLINLKHFFFTF